jgi:hypothetical protein
MAVCLDSRDFAPDDRREAVYEAHIRPDVPREICLMPKQAVAEIRIEARRVMLAAVKVRE